MSDPAKYWPGGIPRHIRCHESPIDEPDAVKEEAKGWLLFIKVRSAVVAGDVSAGLTSPSPSSRQENAGDAGDTAGDTAGGTTSTRGEGSAVRQRRALVDRWASMRQGERDAYQARAPAPSGDDDWCPAPLRSDDRDHHRARFCGLLLRRPLSPRDRALWTKARLLLRRFDGRRGSLLGGARDDGTAAVEPNAAGGPNPVEPAGYNAWHFVEAALFEHMAMTSAGTVIFHYWDNTALFADRETLEGGRLLLCDMSSNGQVRGGIRIWPMYTEVVYNEVMGLGNSAEEIMDDADWMHDEEMQAPWVPPAPWCMRGC